MNAKSIPRIQDCGLSERHGRIVEPIFQGKPDKQIAAKLDLSIQTVRPYLKQIIDRVGMNGPRPLLARQPFHDEVPFI
ncbi:MAG: LuxR C-terminal-related transcriptional regulator [Tepidisphaeraceae bacterium]|jgi:DNA-binding NarL/FixJ family response regulator